MFNSKENQKKKIVINQIEQETYNENENQTTKITSLIEEARNRGGRVINDATKIRRVIEIRKLLANYLNSFLTAKEKEIFSQILKNSGAYINDKNENKTNLSDEK